MSGGERVLPFEASELDGPIGTRFEKVAGAVPERPAVRVDGRPTTYGELRRLARRFAAALAADDEIAARPGPVALLLEAGAPLFSGMLGTLSAGRFYVPLDPGLPRERLEAIAGRLDAAAVITAAAGLVAARTLAGDHVPVRAVEAMTGGGEGTVEAAAGAPGADALAYVLFTSGSTGAPKGVMHSHRNVLHAVRKLAAALALGTDDRLTLLSSPSVGASVSDVFGALLTGGCVCPAALAGDGLRRLPEFLTREGITVLHAVPSVFRSLAATLDGREDLSALRAVRLGGEPVVASDFDLYRNRFPRRCAFHVSYGSTEVSLIRLWSGHHGTSWPGGSPLGHAVEGTDVVLLDGDGRETRGPGEIAVRARTLALGYWQDPEATAAAFADVEGRPGERSFRTGDLGELLPDGCLLHRGRADARWKVRGHRVEAGAVEAALLTVPGVREAAVFGREVRGGTRLAAWIVAGEPGPAAADRVRRVLRATLPASLAPSSLVFLEALPRLPSGKVDAAALPDAAGTRPDLATPYAEPEDASERAVARAFLEALDLDRVGRDDDFFDLGGDSLAAVDALAAASRDLGVELSAADLLENPTPRGLAARARVGGAAEAEALVRLGGGGRPVFVVPGGAGDGDDLFAARRVARATGDGFAFFAFRSGAAPHPPLEELAAGFVRRLRAAKPRGPYALVGDCVGGAVAFAMARQLRASGEDVALVALLDAPFPTPARRRRAWLLRHAPGLLRAAERAAYFRKRLRHHAGALRDAERGRLAYLRRFGKTGAAGIARNRGARERRVLEHRSSYVGAALAAAPARYGGKVLVVESEEWRSLGYAKAWTRVCAESEVVTVPGDHAGFILEQGRRVGEALRRALG